MPDISQPPVFIDQIPEYREALKQVHILSQHKDGLQPVAQALGLQDELAKATDSLAGLLPQAALLEAQENAQAAQSRRLDAQAVRTVKDAAGTAAKVTLATSLTTAGAVALAAKPKSWRLLKGAAAGVIAASVAIATFAANAGKILSGTREERAANHAAELTTEAQGTQLLAQSHKIQEDFIETMATRMLERQVALVQEGGEMKLVSTAQPAPEPVSMAARYATPPAASKAEMVAGNKAACAANAR